MTLSDQYRNLDVVGSLESSPPPGLFVAVWDTKQGYVCAHGPFPDMAAVQEAMPSMQAEWDDIEICVKHFASGRLSYRTLDN